jgi:hypothetical protein
MQHNHIHYFNKSIRFIKIFVSMGYFYIFVKIKVFFFNPEEHWGSRATMIDTSTPRPLIGL